MMLDVIGQLLHGPSAADTGWVNKPADDDWWYGPRGSDSQTGIPVDEHTAMKYATVYSCVAKRSKTIATVPLMVFERLDEEGAKRPARSHPLYRLLHDAPNDEMDAVGFWESRVANMDLWGTCYAERVYGRGGGNLVSLKPLASASITPMRSGAGALFYQQQIAGGGTKAIPARNMLRISGMSLNGITGLSLIGYHSEAIALGLACQRFGARFFRQGANFSGVIESGKAMGDKAYERLKESFDRTYSGLENAHKTLLLEDGATFKSIGMPLKDAQFLELQKFTRTEICGIFDVPPHKIADLERATFSNIEQSNIQWVVDTIAPLGLRISSAINAQLLAGEDGVFCEHVLQSLLRGDILARYQAFSAGRQWGWLSTNDILRAENMNPVPWGDDDHLRPLNMVPASSPYVPSNGNQNQNQDGSGGTAAALPAPAAALLADLVARRISPASLTDNRRDAQQQSIRREVFEPVVFDACRRIVAKECKAVAAAFKKHAAKGNQDGFREWLDGFYGEQRQSAAENVLPALRTIGAAAHYADGAAEAIAEKFATEYAVCSAAAVKDALDHNPDLGLELAAWETDKPAMLAAQLLNQFPC